MTAESLKPFITLPMAENYSSQKRSPHIIFAIGLSALCVMISIVLLGFTIWNVVRVNHLQTEVQTLNKVIASMQKRLGLEYLEDLNEFENAYDNFLVDDPNPYSQDNDSDDDADANDDDGDDEDISEEEQDKIKGIPALLEDYDDDYILNSSGQYDDDDDDDDDHDDMDDSSYDEELDDIIKSVTSKSKKERKIRSISSTSNGVPIYPESYAVKRNRTGGPEDQRIEHLLLVNKSPSPTLRYDWTDKSTRPPAHENPEERVRYQSAPGNMLRQFGHPRHRIHRLHKNQRLVRPLLKSGKGRDKVQSLTSFPALKAVHYHFNGTLSGRHNVHPHHSKLPHDGDIYIGSPHPWARALEMDKTFDLNHGVLTIKEPGLYFLYAQIYYDNQFDRNGFVIYHGIHPFLQCALFVPTNINKSHTCYTSGVTYLERNDELHLRDIHRDRAVMLTHAKSFFGIIKLGDI